MDFIVGLPKTRSSHDAMWVIVDKMIKFAYFVTIKVDDPLGRLERFYLKEIVRLDGILVTITSYCDPHFTFKFWQRLQTTIGTNLSFFLTFHPQTYG